MKSCRILFGCMLASVCLLSGNALAQVVTEFSTGITAGAQPIDITAGPDGNLWFTENVGRIGRITPLGVVTEFSAGITAGAGLYGITAGPDGKPVVHGTKRQPDRADYPRSGSSPSSTGASSGNLAASRPAPMATCGSPK